MPAAPASMTAPRPDTCSAATCSNSASAQRVAKSVHGVPFHNRSSSSTTQRSQRTAGATAKTHRAAHNPRPTAPLDSARLPWLWNSAPPHCDVVPASRWALQSERGRGGMRTATAFPATRMLVALVGLRGAVAAPFETIRLLRHALRLGEHARVVSTVLATRSTSSAAAGTSVPEWARRRRGEPLRMPLDRQFTRRGLRDAHSRCPHRTGCRIGAVSSCL